MGNLLTSALLVLIQLTTEKERYVLYKVPRKPPSKRTTLVKVLATIVYLDK